MARRLQELEWTPLSPFGAEINSDLSLPFTPEAAAQFVRLLWEHGLIIARGQSLSMEQHRALLSHLGPILLREGESGIMTNEAGAGPAVSELAFHADAAYTQHPFDALSLHALDVVDGASSTRFVHAAHSLATLPTDLREALEGHEIEMISPDYEALATRSCNRPEPKALRRGIMPAIYRNPHTGENCLWASELQAARVLDLEWEASRDLLNAVFDHFYRPEHTHEHRWHTGDLIVWDNIALQHARGPLEDVGTRILQRVIVGSEGVAPHIREAA